MKGARRYASLFKTGQYGRLYIVSGRHARGATFRIQVLPAGEDAIPNGPNNLCTNRDAVVVYGIISGNDGWSEEYGWLHRGKWVTDFEELAGKESIAQKKAAEAERRQRDEESKRERRRKRDLLDKY